MKLRYEARDTFAVDDDGRAVGHGGREGALVDSAGPHQPLDGRRPVRHVVSGRAHDHPAPSNTGQRSQCCTQSWTLSVVGLNFPIGPEFGTTLPMEVPFLEVGLTELPYHYNIVMG